MQESFPLWGALPPPPPLDGEIPGAPTFDTEKQEEEEEGEESGRRTGGKVPPSVRVSPLFQVQMD